MKKQFFVMALAIVALATSCKKDKDDNPSDGSKNAKITVSVSSAFNKASGDDFTLSVGGAKISNSGSTFIDWKVDGKNNVGTITTVTSDYVNGGKDNIVVESASSFNTGQVDISSSNSGGEPFTVTYKVEVNGKIVDQQAVKIDAGADPLFKNYQL